MEGAGTGVTAELADGTVTLAGPDGDVTLVFRDGGERALARGKYRLRTVRVARDHGGAHWMISSTWAKGPAVVVRDGETARIPVDETVRFAPRVIRKGQRLYLSFTITGTRGSGLSVYKDDRRVPVTWRLLARDGAVLASGPMTYG